MTNEEYLKDRVDNQIGWYSKKSKINKRLYIGLTISQMAVSATIPLFSFLLNINWVIAALGIIITISTGLIQLFKCHEKWLQYRQTCEVLKREKLLYLNKIQPYNDEAQFETFVRNIEGVISHEVNCWVQINKNERNDINNGKKASIYQL
ncbi:MAG TPA: DUF4231 domain-containing protein [Clostridia bacterium]|nr:DUF4231 domain-containing protein [Clostridia bacterium]